MNSLRRAGWPSRWLGAGGLRHGGKRGTAAVGLATVAVALGASAAFISHVVRAEDGGLKAAWQTKSFPGAFALERPFPVAENGFLVSALPASKNGPSARTIELRSLSDGQVFGVNFWPSGATHVWIGDVSVDPSGNVIVVGSLARGLSIQNFVYQLDRYGNVVSTFDSGSYEPERACSTGDGTIWTFGQDWDAEETGAAYFVLRNYSLNGQVLRSLLPRSQLVVFGLNMSDRLRTLAGPGAGGAAPGRVFLRCANGTVGAYIGPALTWVEVNAAGIQTWQVKPPAAHSTITGIAYLGERSVYASFRTRLAESAGGSAPSVTWLRGLYKLDLSQPSAGRWEIVSGASGFNGRPGSFNVLLGGDSSGLVYLRAGVAPPDGTPTLFWSKP